MGSGGKAVDSELPPAPEARPVLADRLALMPRSLSEEARALAARQARAALLVPMARSASEEPPAREDRP